MPLLVNLHHLEDEDLEFDGEISAEELGFTHLDEMIHVNQPLRYALKVEKLGASLLVEGVVRLTLDCECVRCLRSFQREVRLQGAFEAVPLAGEDAPPIVSDCVDLTPYLREDILLEFPPHPVCGPDCRGVPGMASQARPPEAGVGPGETPPSAWSELDKLRL